MAQEIYNRQTDVVKAGLHEWAVGLLADLYENEVAYTDDVYSAVGLAHDVKAFVRYNANKALMNLGFDAHFPEEPVNPIVINGLSTKTKSFDMFSLKGNGYKKATAEAIRDEDFFFND